MKNLYKIQALLAIFLVGSLKEVLGDELLELSRKLTSEHNRVFVRSNVFFEKITSDEKARFKNMLDAAQKFVGKDNKQRAADMAYIAKLWMDLITNLTSVYGYLSRKTVMCGKYAKDNKLLTKIREEKFVTVAREQDGTIKYFLDAAKVDLGVVKKQMGMGLQSGGNFDKQKQALSEIKERSEAGKTACRAKDCKERFGLVILHTQFLDITLDALVNALSGEEMLNKGFVAREKADPIYSLEEYIRNHAVSSCAAR